MTAATPDIQSATLYKNDQGALPFGANVRKVLVVGPTANISKATAGYYGPGDVCGGDTSRQHQSTQKRTGKGAWCRLASDS